MGRDFGGSLVWSFLDKYPDLVAKSIIINAPHPAVLKHELKSVAQVVKTRWEPGPCSSLPISQLSFHKWGPPYQNSQMTTWISVIQEKSRHSWSSTEEVALNKPLRCLMKEARLSFILNINSKLSGHERVLIWKNSFICEMGSGKASWK